MLGELFGQIVDWVRLVPRWARWGAVALVAVVVASAALRGHGHGGGGRGDATAARPRGAVAAGAVMLRRDGEAPTSWSGARRS